MYTCGLTTTHSITMDYRLYQRLVYLFIAAILLSPVTVRAQTGLESANTALLAKAEQALQSASEVDADSLALVTFQQAATALQQAQQLLLKRKTKDADRFALKSIRYAELSANEAKYIQLKEILENKTAENSRLRRELLLGTTADKP
jgi:hypothetical protein